MKSTWLDRLVLRYRPEAGVRRLQARMAADILLSHQPRNKYEGASKSRRTEGWTTVTGSSQNSETRSQLHLLRERSRDLVRNNPYANRVMQVIPGHMVGTGIIPQAKGRNKTSTKSLEQALKDHLDTQAIDADGRHTLYGLQRLAVRTIIESGEVLIRRRRRKRSDGLPLQFQVQVLEPDYLDTSKDGVYDGNLVVQGVEFDAIGRRVAYWLFDHHPGDALLMRRHKLESRRVSASEIIHCYRTERPGQVRGVPWGSPIIIRLRDFDEYEDYQLMRQKIAACYTVFVRQDEFGVGQPTPNQAESKDPLIDRIEPGLVELLPAGKNVEFASPPAVEGLQDYARINLHAVAAGYGLTYELLTTDQSQVNFASGRMGWLAFHQNLEDWRWNMLIPEVCDGIWQWTLEAAAIANIDTHEAKVTWSPPKRMMISPKEEVPALRDAVRAGQVTPSEMVRQLGYDPEEFFQEFAEDLERFDGLGLVLDIDPRKTNRSGAAQSAADTGNGDRTDDETS